MAYYIQYDQGFNQKRSENLPRKYDRKFIIAVIVVASILLVWLITPVRLAILDYLLPGNGEVTLHAAQEMIKDLKNGQSIKEAFSEFCIEILEHA